MRVLGIETSCDDTGAAIYDADAGLLTHKLASQIDLHQPYGGVVPELAARDHIKTLLPLIHYTLQECGGEPPQAVAYTAGPGLAGALLVGASVGASLAYAWGVPAVGVHHMEGHLLAAMLEPQPPAFPLLSLLVSGGHTLLLRARAFGDYEILGASLDDAVGEAFDKTAKLLGLGYPGGPAIAAAARDGTPGRFTLPRPMTNRPGLDFSFSGLKTHTRTLAARQKLNAQPPDSQTVADIAHAFEAAVVDTLAIKCARALRQTKCPRLVVAGGVGANVKLREKLRAVAAEAGAEVFYPRAELCTDNGAMIAYAGYRRLAAGKVPAAATDFAIRPRWNLTAIDAV